MNQITNSFGVEYPKIPEKTQCVLSAKAHELVYFENVAHVEGSMYQVKSTSDKDKVYVIDLKNLDDHKLDCPGAKYRGNCSHLRAVRIFKRGEC
ncbi:MAG: hypothetical protein AABW47_04505 [Nanoarchaeota archaeon]